MPLLSQRMIMVIVSAIIYFFILVTVPFRIKYIMNRTGKLLVPVEKKNIVMQILIIIFAGLLIGILSIRELGFMADVVICLVAILGCAMGSEEAALSSKTGLYEKGIIGGGHFLPLAEIYALPVLSYSKEEQEAQDPRVLVVSTDKKGTVTFIYSSAEEKNAVEKGLLSLNPALAR